MVVGSLAAAVLGLGLGAWLKPPLSEAANPDPYENVVITLPAEPGGPVGAVYGPISYIAPMVPDSPDSGIAWADAGGGARESASWLQTSDDASAPEVLTPAKLEQVLPDPARDEAPNWPSRQGDILAVNEVAAPVPPFAPEAVQAAPGRSQDPRDWDVPDSAYRKAGFEMHAAANAPAG